MMTFISRQSIRLVQDYLRFFPCVAIVGPRQCGKTTLVRHLTSDWHHFDLEKAGDYGQISADPDLFFRLHPERAAIDEAQVLPALFPALRVAIDASRSEKGRFIITGSSSPDLVHAISESLAGRVGVVELSPLSLEEICGGDAPFYDLFNDLEAGAEPLLTLSSRMTLQEIHHYWFHGGYPEPWRVDDEPFSEAWMGQYVQTYLDRDIAKLFPGLNTPRFRQFVEMLAGFSGRIVNYAEAARALGVSQPTTRDYFHIAHKTFVWRHLPAYAKDVCKRVVKHPKGYLRDSGLLHFLSRIRDLPHLMGHPSMGASWESLVVEELLRGLQNRGVDHDAYHYRTAAGAEVDLVLEGRFGTLPIEIKYHHDASRKGIRALRDFVRENNLPLGIVVDNGEHPRRLDERLVAVPFSCCL
ncbi:MAG: ATP-binding protein [Lentisphaeria bacterium]|nr:ATP-binding protein [Lentisphaeria bacterium]